MADETALVWLLVFVIAIEGVWLAGLTYLMWRKARRKAPPAPEAAPEPPKAP